MNREKIIKVLCPDHGNKCELCGAFKDCLLLKAENYFVDNIIDYTKEMLNKFARFLIKEMKDCVGKDGEIFDVEDILTLFLDEEEYEL